MGKLATTDKHSQQPHSHLEKVNRQYGLERQKNLTNIWENQSNPPYNQIHTHEISDTELTFLDVTLYKGLR